MSVPDWMIDTPSPNVEDMAAVIRQLVRSLRKAAPDNEVAQRAMDYLKKHGLQGSPLRAHPTEAAQPSESYCRRLNCTSCGGSGSTGEHGCTDCLGRGIDPSAMAGGIEAALNDAYAEGRKDEREEWLAAAHPPQAAPAIPEGETLADRLDWLADRQTPGSQTQSDLFAAATIWRKHLKPSLLTQAAPAAVQGEALTRRVIHELRTYNPAADEYKGEHIHKFWARELESTLAATAPVQPVSGLSLAVIGRKHFGNPIPQEWYAAARELLATPPTPPSAPATGGKGGNHG